MLPKVGGLVVHTQRPGERAGIYLDYLHNQSDERPPDPGRSSFCIIPKVEIEYILYL